MRPRPRLLEVRELTGRVADRDHGQWLPTRVELSLLPRQDEQDDPRWQAIVLGRRGEAVGREEPRQGGLVELHDGEVVRLEVVGEGARIGAYDLLRVDPADV